MSQSVEYQQSVAKANTAEQDRRDVQGAAGGCLDSFAQLYQRYYSPMEALAWSILNDRHLAQDAAQETFAQACLGLNRLKQPDKFPYWLAGICRNVARQMVRDRKKFADAAAEASKVEPVGEINDELALAVRNGFEKLPPRAREVLALRYYDNMSYDQMAEVLNISAPAVNSRIIRAKRKLAKYLKRQGITGARL